MKYRFLIYAGILLILSSFLSIANAYGEIVPSLSFFPEKTIISPDVYEAIKRGERNIDVIVWYEYKYFPLSAYQEAHNRLLSMVKITEKYGVQTKQLFPLFSSAEQIITPEILSQVSSLSFVKFIDYNKYVRVNSIESMFLDVEEIKTLLKFEKLYNKGWKGLDIDIYYFDSGAYPGVFRALGITSDTQDRFGHGWAVGYLITSLAPEARVHSVKVLDAYGGGRISDILSALEKILKENEYFPEVINLSLGTKPALFDSLARTFNIVAKRYGISVFASSGNDPGYVSSPAVAPRVVAVGAVNSRLEKAPYSAPGDIYAPGDVYVSWLGMMTGKQGTSFSAPIVSSLWACYLSGQEKRIREINEIETLKKGAIVHENLFIASGDIADVEPIFEPTFQEEFLKHLPILILGTACMIVGVKYEKQ